MQARPIREVTGKPGHRTLSLTHSRTGEEGQRKDAPAAEERDCEPDGACPHRRRRAAGNQRDEALDGIEEKKGVMRVKQHGMGRKESAQASSL